MAKKKPDEPQLSATDEATPASPVADEARACVSRTLGTCSYSAAFLNVPDSAQKEQFFSELERRFMGNPKLYEGLNFTEVKAAFQAHPECILFVSRMEGYMAEIYGNVTTYIYDFGTYFYCGCKDSKSGENVAAVSVLKAPKD
jgi:hypothetical protein